MTATDPAATNTASRMAATASSASCPATLLRHEERHAAGHIGRRNEAN